MVRFAARSAAVAAVAACASGDVELDDGTPLVAYMAPRDGDGSEDDRDDAADSWRHPPPPPPPVVVEEERVGTSKRKIPYEARPRRTRGAVPTPEEIREFIDEKALDRDAEDRLCKLPPEMQD